MCAALLNSVLHTICKLKRSVYHVIIDLFIFNHNYIYMIILYSKYLKNWSTWVPPPAPRYITLRHINTITHGIQYI